MEPSRVRGLNYLLFTLGLLGLVAIVIQSVIIGSIIPRLDHVNSTSSDDYTVVQFERTGSSITAGIIYVLTALVGFLAYIRKSYAMYVRPLSPFRRVIHVSSAESSHHVHVFRLSRNFIKLKFD
jgi:hypothetical protein